VQAGRSLRETLTSAAGALTVRLAAASDDDLVTLLLEEARPVGDAARLRGLGLSEREAEVLQWIGEGKTDAEVGCILGISRDTARKHAENIRQKLQVENRGAAAATYWRLLAGR